MNQLPFFEEGTQVPVGYGIEHSHDEGFYPYRIDADDSMIIHHLKDAQGLDMCCTSRNEALNHLRPVM